MKCLFRKIKNSPPSFFLFVLTGFFIFAIFSFIETSRIEESIAISDQIECLEEAIILLQKKEIERLEKDLEECKDKRQVDCVYRESLK